MGDTGNSTMHVNKDSVRVVIVVDGWRIEGNMHILAGSRLTDAMNSKAKDFLAITDAQVFEAKSGALLSQTQFLAINREAISMIFLAE